MRVGDWLQCVCRGEWGWGGGGGGLPPDMLYKDISCHDWRRLHRSPREIYVGLGAKDSQRMLEIHTKTAHLYGKHEFFGLCTKMIDTSERTYTQEWHWGIPLHVLYGCEICSGTIRERKQTVNVWEEGAEGSRVEKTFENSAQRGTS
jgi:hypothetical protein